MSIAGGILSRVGNTPSVKLNVDHLPEVELWAKLEYYNPTGSVKDRAANYIIQSLINRNQIHSSTVLVESTSGNFGISLSSYCKYYGISFYCVIDPLISPINEKIIRSLSSSVYKVEDRDENGGYLLNRIRKVHELIDSLESAYWVNQYANTLNAEAYYNTLGEEIVREHGEIDYLFVGVSSGGTITGLSRKIKERIPKCKVIAVDIVGSIIFGGTPGKRYIPGIGSSMQPDILQHALIDDVLYVDEVSTINQCHELLKQNFIFSGGSSGSIMAAVQQYFKGRENGRRVQVMAIFCDRGDRYADTIYNPAWVSRIFNIKDRDLGERYEVFQ